jgi:beta-galactosidase
VALLHSYDSRWAINWQRHNKNYDPNVELQSYYAAIRPIAQSVDVLPATANLSSYKLVVAPGLNVLSDDAAKNLAVYVRAGGHLVLGQRSAMKDDDNGLQPDRQPGPIGELLGGRVEQYYALDNPVPIEGQWGPGESPLWAELLGTQEKDTEVLMRYGKSNGWLDGQPAAITRKVGKGRITYIGAWLDPKTMESAAKWMASTSGVNTPLPNVPVGVEVSVRQGAHGMVYILVNLSKQAQTIALPSGMQDVLEGGSKTSVKLNVYDVAVFAQTH